MNIKEYISSGILEAYALGKTTKQETAEVEQLLRQHPEVRAELEAIETALESVAMATALTPAPSVLDQIHQRIDAANPVSTASGSKTPPRQSSSWGWLGLWAALVLSITALLFTFFDRQGLALEKERLSNELIQLQEDCDETRTQLTQNNLVLAALADPINKSIPLTATENFPGNSAHLFVNPDQEVALLDPLTLPTPATDQQYQLWGIVDGQPVSMGVIDPNAQAGDLQQMQYLDNVQLYAVTLEPRGGSIDPTMEQMYVKS